MISLYATSLQSAESIQHLTGSGLFGVFVLLLLVIGMEKWCTHLDQKDRLRMEQARMDKNDAALVESRKMESDSREKLADALNNVAQLTAVNSEKIDQVQDDLKAIGDRVSEHGVRIDRHDVDIDELKRRGVA